MAEKQARLSIRLLSIAPSLSQVVGGVNARQLCGRVCIPIAGRAAAPASAD